VSWLFLHGFTGSPQSFGYLASRLPTRDARAAPRWVAATLSGHLSEPSSAGFWDEVDRLAALAPEATGVCGYSLGGRLALGLLARFPQRFARGVVISAHPGLRTAAERAARREQDDRWVSMLEQQGLPAFVDEWERQTLWESQKTLPKEIIAAKRRERLLHGAQGLAESLTSVGLGCMPDLRPELARSTSRVDLLVGSRDARSIALAEDVCQCLPQARVRVAQGAGHDLVLERPAFCASYLAQEVAT
jgi:2-succinyl-6-hydroxy-2,4-cyclohexadiene-1-carboxylate synthase